MPDATAEPVVLVSGPQPPGGASFAGGVSEQSGLAAALDTLLHGGFAGLYLDQTSPTWRPDAERFLLVRPVLDGLQDGVALLDDGLTVVWANPTFTNWSGGESVGLTLPIALATEGLTAESRPFAEARAGSTGQSRIARAGEGALDMRVTYVSEPRPRYVVYLRDVTAEERRQRTLDALTHAGRALADLDTEQLAELSPPERIELLKGNIRQIARDLLHYDLIEVRLLDPHTGRLDSLLEEGMVQEAVGRELFAKPEGNGVTGLVASTGQSYVCADTASDPHYLTGAAEARSSLTVPLIWGDAVVGTLNVESPRAGAFAADDVLFTEMLGREIASALHTLDLLSAQGTAASAASLEAIRRDMALPADDILAAATALLSKAATLDAEAVGKLRVILDGVRSIKRGIRAAEAAVADAAKAPSEKAKAVVGQRILVVDADERVRRSAHGLLGRLGCDVETARTGAEAVAMAGQGGYDAILIDIALPDLSGYEAYRQLRAACPDARVILMTAFGYDASHSIVKARQDGCRSVLFKPFRTDQVVDALTAAGPTPA